MTFIYKIHSGYDGFTPKRIPEHLVQGSLLWLAWARYIDVVEKGQEVWVYFHGPHRFTNGVYVKAFVHAIDYDEGQVLLSVSEYSTANPLTDDAKSFRIAQLVETRCRQVAFMPEDWDPSPTCTVNSSTASCKDRQCEACSVWQGLPLVKVKQHKWPSSLPTTLSVFASAYWVIPFRCFLFSEGWGYVRRPIRNTSEFFYRFKLGDDKLAFPLALGMYKALQLRDRLAFDCIVPIPLSPKKLAAGEIHHTRLLAGELAKLLGTSVVECLSLTTPVSKTALRSAGFTAAQVESKYAEALDVHEKIKNYERVLLVDDVCTRGRTIRFAVRGIRSIHPSADITAACAGQMIVKEAVVNPSQLVE